MEHLLLLRNIMEKEEADYCRLLTLSEQEKDAVIQNDIPTLSSILEKQQEVLTDINGLEAEKQRIVSVIRREANLPEGGLGVQDVIKTAPEPLHRELRGLLTEIEDISKRIHRINSLNRTLIETQLQYTQFCMNTLTGRDAAPATYSGSGRVQESSAQRCLVDQAI